MSSASNLVTSASSVQQSDGICHNRSAKSLECSITCLTNFGDITTSLLWRGMSFKEEFALCRAGGLGGEPPEPEGASHAPRAPCLSAPSQTAGTRTLRVTGRHQSL